MQLSSDIGHPSKLRLAAGVQPGADEYGQSEAGGLAEGLAEDAALIVLKLTALLDVLSTVVLAIDGVVVEGKEADDETERLDEISIDDEALDKVVDERLIEELLLASSHTLRNEVPHP
jgi:hypothetical protein